MTFQINELKKNTNSYLSNIIIDTYKDFINEHDKNQIQKFIERYTNVTFFNKQLMISTTALYRIIDYIKLNYNYQCDFQKLYANILNSYDKNTFAFINTNRGFVNFYILNSITDTVQQEIFESLDKNIFASETNRNVLVVEDTTLSNFTLKREQYFVNFIKSLYKDCSIFTPSLNLEETSQLYKDYFVEEGSKSYIDGKLMFEDGKPTELFNQLILFTDILKQGADKDIIICINNICPTELVKIFKLINLDLEKVENIKINAFKIIDNEQELSSDAVDNINISNDTLQYEFMKSMLSARLSINTSFDSKSIAFIQTLYSKICGLFKYAKEHEIVSELDYSSDVNTLNGLDKTLLLTLVCYQDKLDYIRKSNLYSELFNYLQNICTLFKKSYSGSRYIDKDNLAVTRAKLIVAKFMQYVLRDVLSIYGIVATEDYSRTDYVQNDHSNRNRIAPELPASSSTNNKPRTRSIPAANSRPFFNRSRRGYSDRSNRLSQNEQVQLKINEHSSRSYLNNRAPTSANAADTYSHGSYRKKFDRNNVYKERNFKSNYKYQDRKMQNLEREQEVEYANYVDNNESINSLKDQMGKIKFQFNEE